jgi:hypothetical protein
MRGIFRRIAHSLDDTIAQRKSIAHRWSEQLKRPAESVD